MSKGKLVPASSGQVKDAAGSFPTAVRAKQVLAYQLMGLSATKSVSSDRQQALDPISLALSSRTDRSHPLSKRCYTGMQARTFLNERIQFGSRCHVLSMIGWLVQNNTEDFARGKSGRETSQVDHTIFVHVYGSPYDGVKYQSTRA